MDLLLMIVIAAGAASCAAFLRWMRFPGGVIASGIVGGAIAGVLLSGLGLGKVAPGFYDRLIRGDRTEVETLKATLDEILMERAVLEEIGASPEAAMEHEEARLTETLLELGDAVDRADWLMRTRLAAVAFLAGAVVVGGIAVPRPILLARWFVFVPLLHLYGAVRPRAGFDDQLAIATVLVLTGSYALGRFASRASNAECPAGWVRLPPWWATAIVSLLAIPTIVAATLMLSYESGHPGFLSVLPYALIGAGVAFGLWRFAIAPHIVMTPWLSAHYLAYSLSLFACVITIDHVPEGLLGAFAALLLIDISLPRRPVHLTEVPPPQPTPPNDR